MNIEKRTVRFIFRLTPEELEKIHRYSEYRGQKMSALVRQFVFPNIDRERRRMKVRYGIDILAKPETEPGD